MSSTPRATFLEELSVAQQEMRTKMETYTACWNSGDMPTILSYFADEGLDYSDYGTMALHMDKKTVIEYFKGLQGLWGDISFTTTGVFGAVNFCAWECILEFTQMAEDAGSPYKKGDRGKMFNTSIIEWNSEGKIIRESDYPVWAIPFPKAEK